MDTAQKFRHEILRQRVKQLQCDPFAALQELLGVETPEEIPQDTLEEFIDTWQERCRLSAAIFDDTYSGMPKEEAVSIIIKNDFRYYMKVGKNLDSYLHEYLDILVVTHFSDENRLLSIKGRAKLNITQDSVTAKSCCGLGLISPDINGDVLSSQIDMTFGFNVKMFILKGMVAA